MTLVEQLLQPLLMAVVYSALMLLCAALIVGWLTPRDGAALLPIVRELRAVEEWPPALADYLRSE